MVPSITVNMLNQKNNSSLRKGEQSSMLMVPTGAIQQPLEMIDTTFVLQSEAKLYDDEIENGSDDDDDDDECNKTHRIPEKQNYLHIPGNEPETMWINSQRNMPARFCFSPTILRDASASYKGYVNEQSSSPNHKQNEKSINTILDENQTSRIDKSYFSNSMLFFF